MSPPPRVNPQTGVSEITPAFLGRWGLTAADCEPGRADAKGLLTIQPEEMRFYESVGRPTAQTRMAPARVAGPFRFTGEGQTWTRNEVLILSADGRQLVRKSGDLAPDLTYSRCPG